MMGKEDDPSSLLGLGNFSGVSMVKLRGVYRTSHFPWTWALNPIMWKCSYSFGGSPNHWWFRNSPENFTFCNSPGFWNSAILRKKKKQAIFWTPRRLWPKRFGTFSREGSGISKRNTCSNWSPRLTRFFDKFFQPPRIPQKTRTQWKGVSQNLSQTLLLHVRLRFMVFICFHVGKLSIYIYMYIYIYCKFERTQEAAMLSKLKSQITKSVDHSSHALFSHNSRYPESHKDGRPQNGQRWNGQTACPRQKESLIPARASSPRNTNGSSLWNPFPPTTKGSLSQIDYWGYHTQWDDLFGTSFEESTMWWKLWHNSHSQKFKVLWKLLCWKMLIRVGLKPLDTISGVSSILKHFAFVMQPVMA